MSRFDAVKTLSRGAAMAAVAFTLQTLPGQAQPVEPRAAFAGVGRSATPAELKAWDIDVRPDFKGLPKGRGSVRHGEVIWEAQCASCHGSFGESAEIFTPLAGGTTPQDIKNGRVDGLMPGANQPNRTTLMKVATVSTLWDYINRAMPWNAPKTLKTDEVYAVTAYLLNLGNVLPDDFTLSDTNIRDVQARMPNRNGMTTAHALWPGKELGGAARPDTQGSACMSNCASDVVIKSFLPDYARNAHGNLAEQNRPVGAFRGANTTQPPPARIEGSNQPPAQAGRGLSAPETIAEAKPAAVAATASPAKPPAGGAAALMPILQKNACVACHGMDTKLVGPSFRDIANKYKDRADAVPYLSDKIRSGGQGVWGAIPMPAQSLGADDAAKLAQWLAAGAAR